uniref:Uncharacterized protein n=1 Tax=Pygocentrus nattereri TaxID=42514 RepID=A0A3B4D776_PYGNA
MSSSGSLLSEDLFQCTVCLNVFTQPVSLPCGHTFCLSCIQTQWVTTGSPHCPKCLVVFQAPPELRENSFADEMARQIREQKGKTTTEHHGSQVAVCDLCPARKPLRAVKSCLICLVSYCEQHVASHATRFTKHTLVQPWHHLEERMCKKHERPLELFCRYDQTCVCVLCTDTEHQSHHQKAAERQAEELIKELEIEVAKLKVKNSELEQLVQSEDNLHLLQVSAPYNDSLFFFFFVTCPLKETEICNFQPFSNLAVDLTLDPITANPWLEVSADGKCVKDGNVEQKVPDDPRRFDTAPCVLAREPMSRGRSYWEVEVANKTAWDLGVARQSVNRKGLVMLSPNDGYWAICLRRGREYRACDGESVLLSLRIQPQRIAIFVSYEDGQVSFYDPVSKVHIFSFTGQRFTEGLLAFFNPDVNDSGNNRAPLIIRTVRHQANKSYDSVTI